MTGGPRSGGPVATGAAVAATAVAAILAAGALADAPPSPDDPRPSAASADASAGDEVCTPPTATVARYRVTSVSRIDPATGRRAERPKRGERELYREDHRVLHVDRSLGVADHFATTPNGRVRSVRYFDRHERSIAYEPADLALVRPGGGDPARGGADGAPIGPDPFARWWRPSGWASASGIARTPLIGIEGEGCERLERRALEREDRTIELEWWPALDLPKFQRIARGGASVTWELIERDDDPERVAAAFAARADYAETDFADVGDNESDLFLQRMIVLGFVEHPEKGGHAH